MHQDDLNEKDEFILFFKIVLYRQSSYGAARNYINSAPQTAAMTIAVFLLSLSFFFNTHIHHPQQSKWTPKRCKISIKNHFPLHPPLFTLKSKPCKYLLYIERKVKEKANYL